MRTKDLFPHLKSLHFEHVTIGTDCVTISLALMRRSARCPLCRRRSRRVHSRYHRTLADLPISGRRVILGVRVRRFRCLTSACPRQIFAERLPDLAAPFARRSQPLQQALYAALGIEKREIERGKPWQNYIETTFKIQRRMADWDFARATGWAELLNVHDQWVADYNFQSHWAHQERTDGRLTPRDVLGWVRGREVVAEELHRLFYRTRFGRKLDRLGYVRFRHWRAYGEHGLAKEHAAVWLYADTLTIEFADEPMAQYRVRYQPDKAHLLAVEAPLLFKTPYQSAQLSLWELSDAEWLKVVRRPPYAPRTPQREPPQQAALFG